AKLISDVIHVSFKDHERAFFDSADWALGKQKGQKPKGPLEALRPKLQPTPHQQPRARRMALSSGDNTEDAEADNNEPLDDQASASAADNAKDDGGGIDAADAAKDNVKS
ncbi:uncharacterized protein LOC130505698, partial [Raphanus sativus]|uniref:Uncharacterized protein LOC130505698 n=1 Tax=Raphanus sativus TaxID=3726 RepID=A0A9W3CXS0_RAPSA